MIRDYINKKLILDGNTEIDFTKRTVSIDGVTQKDRLSKTHIKILKWLIEAYPRATSVSVLKERWEQAEWSFNPRLSELTRLCGYPRMINGENKRLTKKITGEECYMINPDISLRWVDNFSIETLPENEIFIEPDNFIEPVEWLDNISANAFIRRRVHAISGERGMGKSSLARLFAARCKEPKFQNVIFTSYTDDLENTLTSLKCVGETDIKMDFRKKLDLLASLQGETLLIIDNYDDEKYKTELSENSEIFRALRDTGIYVLITSKRDLSDCHLLRQTKISALPLEELTDLFISLSPNKPEKKEAADLIQNYLMGNTYLVRLTARLMRTRSFQEIVNAFHSLDVAEMSEPFYDNKDEEERSLFAHFSALYNLSNIDENKLQVLWNIILLSPEGENYTRFFENSFDEECRSVMQQSFNSLEEAYWVSLSKRQITIHPVVREIIARRKKEFNYHFIEKHIKFLKNRMFFRTYESNLPAELKRGVAACEILRILDINNFDSACLSALVSSCYDILSRKSQAYKWGKWAIEKLLKVRPNDLSLQDKYTLADCLNSAGYAVLHDYDSCDSLDVAKKAFDKAKRIIIGEKESWDHEFKMLYTSNLGNYGAYYMQKGKVLNSEQEFKKMFNCHKKNAGYRKELLKEIGSTTRIQEMLGASYTGMGSALYYRSDFHIGKEKKGFLKESYENHIIAVKWYTDAYFPNYHLEIATADNRCVGTLLELLLDLDETGMKNQGREAMLKMEKSISFLLKMDSPNLVELNNSRNNLSKLVEILRNELNSEEIEEAESLLKKSYEVYP